MAGNYEVIDKSNHAEIYEMCDELIAKFHSHLLDARIALVWRSGWKPNKDGRLVLGKCRKNSEIDFKLMDFDFVILLNKEAWEKLQDNQRRALLDHELCHAGVEEDEDGLVIEDKDGRSKWRIRKHDLEEFREIVERHGMYQEDISDFVEAAKNHKPIGLFDDLDTGT